MSDARIRAAFRGAASSGRAALVPYLTAGYPDRAESLAALRVAGELGDLVEVGVPFSDPVADGPTIQQASLAALRGGMTLAGTLELVAEARLAAPTILFSYLNPVLRYGIERLLADAASAGIAGVLLTDLPAGADADVELAVERSELCLIRLVGPTSDLARVRTISERATGFLYLIARLGVTGASPDVAEDLRARVASLRTVSSLPIAVGFGIATASQASAVAAVADGVVVGSALVEATGRGGAAGARRFLEGIRAGLVRRSAA